MLTNSPCLQVKNKLGPHRAPHLCQLFVTADSYGSNNIRFSGAVRFPFLPPYQSHSGLHSSQTKMVALWAPLYCNDLNSTECLRMMQNVDCVLVAQYVQECLSGPDNNAPVVIGGVVQVLLWCLNSLLNHHRRNVNFQHDSGQRIHHMIDHIKRV